MRTRLLYLQDVIHTSFWFVPALMTIAAIALAFIMVGADRLLSSETDWSWDWAYGGGAEGARSVLSTVAGSMMTVAGVVFSITIVALTLASSQFGPRLLRNFIRDRSNQFVLGAFIATFLYCLIVLRTVRGGDEGGQFVPSLSVMVAVLLAVLNIAVLIYFIHHVATSIRASQVIAAVSHELRDTLERIFPEKLGQDASGDMPEETPAELPESARPGAVVRARHGGYVLAIDNNTLMEITRRENLVVHLLRRPGHFVVEGDPVARAWPSERLTEDNAKAVAECLQIGRERTAFQDVEFCIDQLVEVALRALSPGVNDPFTAIHCVDHLGEALCEVVRRKIPSPYRLDDDGRLRVIAYPSAAADMLEASFDQIRQYGRSSVAVMHRLMETLARVARHARRAEDLVAVARYAELVRSVCEDNIHVEKDRADIDEVYAEVREALGEKGMDIAAR